MYRVYESISENVAISVRLPQETNGVISEAREEFDEGTIYKGMAGLEKAGRQGPWRDKLSMKK